jgi:hypothetical protein
MKLLEFKEPLIKTLFNVVVPDSLNDDNTVVLLDVKLYEVISYTTELFLILFIIYKFSIK